MHITVFLQVQFMFIFLLLLVPSIDFQLLPFYLSLGAEGDGVKQKVPTGSLGMSQGALNSLSHRTVGLCWSHNHLITHCTWPALLWTLS